MKHALLLFFSLFIPFNLFAQIPDPTISICGGGQRVCATSDSQQVCIKIILDANYNKPVVKYEIDWGDFSTKTIVPGSLNPANQIHYYNLKNFYSTCNSNKKYFITLSTFVTGTPDPVENIIPLNIVNPPKSIFKIQPNPTCKDAEVTLVNNSCPTTGLSDPNIEYGDGSAVTKLQKHTYKTVGTFTAKMTVSNECGTSTSTQLVEVLDKPIAKINPDSGFVLPLTDPLKVCLGGGGYCELDGAISENETIYDWVWNKTFGWAYENNTNKSSPKIKLKFTTEGDYIVTLTVTNPCGAKSTKTLNIKVLKAEQLFLNTPNIECLNVKYIPTPYNSKAIYFVNGNLTSTFPVTLGIGNHTIKANLDNECGSQEKIVTFSVLDIKPIKVNNDTSVCQGTALIPLKASLSGGIWTGTNVIFQAGKYFFDPKNAGNFSPIYTVGTGNCKQTPTFNIEVKKDDVLTLNPQKSVCNELKNYNPITTPLSGAVYTINGNPVTFPIDLGIGKYLVKASFSGSCSKQEKADSFEVKTIVPIAFATPFNDTTLCFNTTKIKLQATPKGGIWKGQNVVLQNGDYFYNPITNGSFTITYVTDENTNCEQSKVLTITVKDDAKILPFVKQSDVCDSLLYEPKPYFAFAKYNLDGKDIANFPVKLYQKSSAYTIICTYGEVCPIQKMEDNFSVNLPEESKILTKDTSFCLKDKVFTINVLNNNGLWNEPTVTQKGNSFVFEPQKTGIFTLVYTKGSGTCLRKDSLKIDVQDITANLKDTSICTYAKPFPLNFTPKGGAFSSPDCPQCIDNQGVFDVSKNTTNLSKITIKYLVKNTLGCAHEVVSNVNIAQPKANFTFQNTCEGTNINLDSSQAQGSRFEWLIDNQKIFINQTSQLAAGNHLLKMIAYTSDCSDTIEQQIYITTKPILTPFSIKKIGDCAPIAISFSPIKNAQNDVKYLWDFGRKKDDTLSVFTPQSIDYQVKQGKNAAFKATLTAFNECATLAWDTTFSLKTKPKVELAIDSSKTGCSPYGAIIVNRTEGEEISYSLLDFGNGKTDSVYKSYYPMTYFAGDSNAVFKVFFTAKNTCGEDSDTIEITVKSPKVKAFYELKDYEICPDSPIQFKESGTPKPDKVKWDFGNNTFSNELNPIHAFTEKNKEYKIILYAYSPVCEGYDSIAHIVTTKDAPNTVFAVPDYPCQNQLTFGLKNETKNAFKFLWKSDNWQDSTNISPTPIFDKNNQTINISLTTFSVEGCSNTLTKPLFVRAKPKPDFEIVSVPLCQPAKVEIKNLSQNATNYTWLVNKSEVSKSKNPTLTFDKKGFYDITLIANYENTCFDTLIKENILELFDCQVFIPTIFSPNKEGQNNIFTVYGNSSLQKFDLKITDRWGSLLYDQKNLKPESEGWDGSVNGNESQSSVYIYQILVYYSDGMVQEKKGSVTILR